MSVRVGPEVRERAAPTGPAEHAAALGTELPDGAVWPVFASSCDLLASIEATFGAGSAEHRHVWEALRAAGVERTGLGTTPDERARPRAV